MGVGAVSGVSFGVKIDRNLSESVRAGFERALRDIYTDADVNKLRKELTARLADIKTWGGDDITLGMKVYNNGYSQLFLNTPKKTLDLTDVLDEKSPFKLFQPLVGMTKAWFQKVVA